MEKRMEHKKENKSSDLPPPPPAKKQRIVTECVLIPKHKYEQLEKDAAKGRSSLEPSLSSPPSDDKSNIMDNNDNWSQPLLDVKLGADDETISNTDDDDDDDDDDNGDIDDGDYDVLESFNSAEFNMCNIS